jgi:hypothetical protein
MKVKILNSSGWYRDKVDYLFEIEENTEYYDIHSNLRFEAKNNGWIYDEDCVIIELPKEFCVKNCEYTDKDKWIKYIGWLNKTYDARCDGFLLSCYGINHNNKAFILNTPHGVELHIDDIIKHIEYMENKGETKVMETQKLTRQGLKEIYSVACTRWKKLLGEYGKRNILEDYIELTQVEIDNMFKDCNPEQLVIVSKHLKQDDGSVDLTNIKLKESGWTLNDVYVIRQDDLERDRKSFWLNNDFNWEIKFVFGFPRLYPTKKK